MPHRRYYVYILSNKHSTVFYIGITNDITRRIREHREGHIKGFSKQYNLTQLVYVEEFDDVQQAIRREKQLKNWHREWKLNLIRQANRSFRISLEGGIACDASSSLRVFN